MFSNDRRIKILESKLENLNREFDLLIPLLKCVRVTCRCTSTCDKAGVFTEDEFEKNGAIILRAMGRD